MVPSSVESQAGGGEGSGVPAPRTPGSRAGQRCRPPALTRGGRTARRVHATTVNRTGRGFRGAHAWFIHGLPV
jgi:hypothetical protein